MKPSGLEPPVSTDKLFQILASEQQHINKQIEY
jgi:hypothetical protein